MSRRKLHDDEIALWRRVAENTEPMHPRAKSAPLPQILQLKTRLKPIPEPIPVFTVGEKSRGRSAGSHVLPGLTDRLQELPVNMDKKAFGKLKRGKLAPEARLDLHGMTVDRAHNALTGFVMRAYTQQKRLVLVITGKGKRSDDMGPIPVRQGVLRHNVPHWLTMPPLSEVVMQVTAAHGRHGGGGAYYIYLRRHR